MLNVMPWSAPHVQFDGTIWIRRNGNPTRAVRLYFKIENPTPTLPYQFADYLLTRNDPIWVQRPWEVKPRGTAFETPRQLATAITRGETDPCITPVVLHAESQTPPPSVQKVLREWHSQGGINIPIGGHWAQICTDRIGNSIHVAAGNQMYAVPQWLRQQYDLENADLNNHRKI